MYDQEMQFADPDWKPTRPLNTQGQDQDTYVPQPINEDVRKAREQREQQTAPPLEAGYRGLPPYTPPPTPTMQSPYFSAASQKIGPVPVRQRARRGRGAWFWVIIAIIVLSMVSQGFNRGLAPRGMPGDFTRPFSSDAKSAEYAVSTSSTPTLVMNDNFGTITVQTGNVGTITVQTPREVAGDVNVQPSTDSNTLTITVSGNAFRDQNADITVIVPQNTALHLTDNGGDINVNDVTGQMSLTANNGSIRMNNDALSGQSTVTTDGGSITFNGSLDPAGNYQFKTGSGNIDVTIPGSSDVLIHESPGTGSFTNDFPSTSIGKPPQASLTLTTDSGAIAVHQQ